MNIWWKVLIGMGAWTALSILFGVAWHFARKADKKYEEFAERQRRGEGR